MKALVVDAGCVSCAPFPPLVVVMNMREAQLIGELVRNFLTLRLQLLNDEVVQWNALGDDLREILRAALFDDEDRRALTDLVDVLEGREAGL